MFNQDTQEEKKLDWMYKGPNSAVNREEYLLGRSVDKTLEQLNEEDKQKQSLIPVPKNRVEHECIPPSIRDFNKLVQAEQVDLSTKLQEDPLVAIKKREEETRRQFLQNPVQLKKLQKALKAQQAKKKKKKKKSKQSSDSDGDLEQKLAEKLLGKKNKKVSKEERQLDTILIHKFEALKDKLSENDLQDILSGKFSDSDDSSEDEKAKKLQESADESEEEKKERHPRTVDRNKKFKKRRDSSHEDNSRKERYRDREKSKVKSGNNVIKEHRRNTGRDKNYSRHPYNKSSSESESESKKYHSKRFDSDDSDSSKNKKSSYGLVSSDGKQIPLSRKYSEKQDAKVKTKAKELTPPIQKRRAHKLTDTEKERLRQQMMDNAVSRDKERVHNVKKYREKEEKERKEQSFDPDFIHKQLLKSADTSSVESRIRSNLNNIQRSSRDMDKHFSRR